MPITKRLKPVYEGESFQRTYTFLDENDTLIPNDDLTHLSWKLLIKYGEVITEKNVEPPSNPSTLNITPTMNTLQAEEEEEEERVLVCKWRSNNDEKGRVDIYLYTLKPTP